MENIEVELRTFISAEKRKEILEIFSKREKTLEKQITTYYNCPQDFRLMETSKYCKLWLKEGKMHEEARREYEVIIDKKYQEALISMIKALGYEEQIKWYRNRITLWVDNIKVTIDETIGYGEIIEGEIIVNNKEEIERGKEEIRKLFSELKIENLSSKEEFNQKYEDYKKNWKIYTKEIGEEFFSENN